MDKQEFEVRLNTVNEPRPSPVFAQHIQTVTVNEFVSLRFYSILFPSKPAEMSEHEVDAHLTAEIVVPKDVFDRLISNVTESASSSEESS